MNQLKKYIWLAVFCMLAACGKDELLGTKSDNPHLLLSLRGKIVEDDVDSSSVKLPEVALGQTSKATFTITNQGAAELRISQITTDNNLFTITQAEKAILKSNESTTFTVSFIPERFGERIGYIGFKTNDQENSDFLFKVVGSSIRELSISYLKTDLPEGINTASLAGGTVTKFKSTLELFDPFIEVDGQTELVISAVFSNGVIASLVKTGANSGFLVNNSLTAIRFNFSIAFGESDYVDMKVFLRLPNGKKTTTITYRIHRPDGAS